MLHYDLAFLDRRCLLRLAVAFRLRSCFAALLAAFTFLNLKGAFVYGPCLLPYLVGISIGGKGVMADTSTFASEGQKLLP